MLPGVDAPAVKPATSFRSSWTQPERATPTLVHEARVLDVNLTNYTVDCVTVFEQKRFFDVQVAAPYAHFARGEGMYAVPDVGAKCLVCVPSDGSPPVVLAFIMPSETMFDASSAGDGRVVASGATYAGGRQRPKMGDVTLRGRDGNFVTLHRGGVLQVGSTELAQRIYIPLSNVITDISQTYNHLNGAGCLTWGIRPMHADNPEAEHRQVFRVYAGDEYADVRVAIGKVSQPLQEPLGEAGSTLDLSALGIGSEPIVFECSVAPGGFDAATGQPHKDTRDAVKVRMFFDRAGGTMLRAEGSVSLRVRRTLRIRTDENFEVLSGQDVVIQSERTMRIAGGGSLALGTNGGVVTLNGGTKPVAHVGSLVRVVVSVPIPILVGGVAGTITAGAVMTGQIQSGNSTILV